MRIPGSLEDFNSPLRRPLQDSTTRSSSGSRRRDYRWLREGGEGNIQAGTRAASQKQTGHRALSPVAGWLGKRRQGQMNDPASLIIQPRNRSGRLARLSGKRVFEILFGDHPTWCHCGVAEGTFPLDSLKPPRATNEDIGPLPTSDHQCLLAAFPCHSDTVTSPCHLLTMVEPSR